MKWNTENEIMNIILEEDLIASKVLEFKEQIINEIDDSKGVNKILVNLEKTENIDSVGVTFIISLYKTANRDGKDFEVKGSSEDIKQLFKLMKLDDFFNLDD
ncbi:MAG: STAS domain-containing protein [Acidaminobacteraceae bacterium]|jgi:anti-anti-sigma factor